MGGKGLNKIEILCDYSKEKHFNITIKTKKLSFKIIALAVDRHFYMIMCILIVFYCKNPKTNYKFECNTLMEFH